MRIVLTVPSLQQEFGGPTDKANGLADALRSLDHDVRIVGAGSSSTPGSIGIQTIGSFHGTPIPVSLKPLLRVLRGADIVHVIGYRDPIGTIAARVAKRWQIPLVLEPAGMLRPRLRSFALKRVFDATAGRSLIANARAVIATSSLERQDLTSAGVPRPKIRVRPNGVDFTQLLPLPERGPFRARVGIPPDAPLVVTIARIGAIKDLPTVARALGTLPAVYWLLAGPDQHDGTLEEVRAALAASNAADRAVILDEGIWGDEKGAALAEADVFCLPSTYESFGTAVIEAAGVGLPVVITQGCGAKDVLSEGSASAVPVGDDGRLADALAASLEPLIRKAAVLEAAAVRERLSWRAIAHEQVEIYGSLITEP